MHVRPHIQLKIEQLSAYVVRLKEFQVPQPTASLRSISITLSFKLKALLSPLQSPYPSI